MKIDVNYTIPTPPPRTYSITLSEDEAKEIVRFLDACLNKQPGYSQDSKILLNKLLNNGVEL